MFVALHILLISFVPWTTKRVPAAAYAGAASIDLCAMLWMLSLLQKREEKAEQAILRRSRKEMNPTVVFQEPQEADSLRE